MTNQSEVLNLSTEQLQSLNGIFDFFAPEDIKIHGPYERNVSAEVPYTTEGWTCSASRDIPSISITDGIYKSKFINSNTMNNINMDQEQSICPVNINKIIDVYTLSNSREDFNLAFPHLSVDEFVEFLNILYTKTDSPFEEFGKDIIRKGINLDELIFIDDFKYASKIIELYYNKLESPECVLKKLQIISSKEKPETKTIEIVINELTKRMIIN